MIRIHRPDRVPARLKRLGEKQTRLDCEAYDANLDDYHSGQESFRLVPARLKRLGEKQTRLNGVLRSAVCHDA